MKKKRAPERHTWSVTARDVGLNVVISKKWKTLADAATHQNVHIEDPAVFSWTDAEALKVHAVFVVEDFVESVAQLRSQLLASSALKLRGRIGRTSDGRWKQHVRWISTSLGCLILTVITYSLVDASHSEQVIQHYLLVAGYPSKHYLP